MRNHLSLIVVALGLALSIGTASADDFDTGWDAYEAGEYAEAVKWYRLAAEQGDAKAQYNLALMYDEGEGVIQNNVIAHMLYNLAGAQGYKNGRKNRDVISERMTPNDISRAQEMAATCLEKNYKGCGF
jgi:TPR repeat protein